MSRSQKARRNGRDSCIIPIHCVIVSSFTTGFNTFTLQPSANFGTRLLAAADEWAHFRVLSFEFRLFRNATITVAQAAGYVGGVQDTAPTTIATVAELLSSCLISITQTVPSEWCRPSRQELAGCFPWYKSVPGSADPTEEGPGQVTIVGTGSEVFMLEVRGRFEFKTSVATTNTPDAIIDRMTQKILRKQEIEKRRMMALLYAADALNMKPGAAVLRSQSLLPMTTGNSSQGAVVSPLSSSHPVSGHPAPLNPGM